MNKDETLIRCGQVLGILLQLDEDWIRDAAVNSDVAPFYKEMLSALYSCRKRIEEAFRKGGAP